MLAIDNENASPTLGQVADASRAAVLHQISDALYGVQVRKFGVLISGLLTKQHQSLLSQQTEGQNAHQASHLMDAILGLKSWEVAVQAVVAQVSIPPPHESIRGLFSREVSCRVQNFREILSREFSRAALPCEVTATPKGNLKRLLEGELRRIHSVGANSFSSLANGMAP